MHKNLGKDIYGEKTEAKQGNRGAVKFNWMVCDWLSLGFEFCNLEAFKDRL